MSTSAPTRPSPVATLEGIACVYDVVDSHNTMFAPGSLDSSRAAIDRGEVKLFIDHGESMSDGFYKLRNHVGTVTSLVDGTLPSGMRASRMTANIFDTTEGRAPVEYLEQVLAGHSLTGLSIAGWQSTWLGSKVQRDGRDVFRYTKAGLLEISVMPIQSVPGAVVTKLTRRPADGWMTDEQKAAALRASFAKTEEAAAPLLRAAGLRPAASPHRETPGRSRLATMDERLTVYRKTFAR